MANSTADQACAGKPERRSMIPEELPIVHDDLTDEQWNSVSQAFPGEYARNLGRPRELSFRSLLDGILYKHARKCSWRKVPNRYGRRSSLNFYYRQWALDGTLSRVAVRMQIAELRPSVDKLRRLEAEDEKLARRPAQHRAALLRSRMAAAAEAAEAAC